MITMKTGSKTPVRFVFSDLISETTITIQPDDESADIAAKLRRVLELEGGHTAVIQNSRHLPPPAPVPVFTPADREATEARVRATEESLNGWNAVDIDALPEK